VRTVLGALIFAPSAWITPGCLQEAPHFGKLSRSPGYFRRPLLHLWYRGALQLISRTLLLAVAGHPGGHGRKSEERKCDGGYVPVFSLWKRGSSTPSLLRLTSNEGPAPATPLVMEGVVSGKRQQPGFEPCSLVV
jgi:hypothetical protein